MDFRKPSARDSCGVVFLLYLFVILQVCATKFTSSYDVVAGPLAGFEKTTLTLSLAKGSRIRALHIGGVQGLSRKKTTEFMSALHHTMKIA